MDVCKLILVACLLLSCNDTTQKFDQQALDLKRSNIISFINASPCSSTTGCSFIAAGSKACGGPTEFFIYPKTVDVAKLKQMVDAYTMEMSSYNLKWKVISDCSIAPPPDSTQCVNGACWGYWSGMAKRQE